MRNAGQPETVLAALKAQNEAIAELKASITQPQNPLAVPESIPNPALQDISAQLTAIAERMSALEAAKPVADAPLNTAPLRLIFLLQNKLARGVPYSDELETLAQLPALKDEAEALAALRFFATTGIPNDLTLRAGFNAAGAAPLATNGSPTAEKINNRLGGLVTIKRRSAITDPSLRDLPADTSILTLIESINALPEESRAPFAGWLATIAARDKAMQALITLQNKLLPI